MNAYLKEIADLCQISKVLTSHIARHTFATTITLTNGVPIESVSSMLGLYNADKLTPVPRSKLTPLPRFKLTPLNGRLKISMSYQGTV